MSSYVAHYNEERPHQGKDNRPLRQVANLAEVPLDATRIVCEERLGGLLKHYRYAA